MAKRICSPASLRRKRIPLRKRRNRACPYCGIVDVPFPRSVRDALLAAGLAEEHRWVPNSGRITFHVHSEEDLKHALWLMRLSYLRYLLKTASDPRGLLENETEELRLSPRFKSLLERFAETPVLGGSTGRGGSTGFERIAVREPSDRKRSD